VRAAHIRQVEHSPATQAIYSAHPDMAAVRSAGMRAIRSAVSRSSGMRLRVSPMAMVMPWQASASRQLSFSAPRMAASGDEEEEQPPAELEHAVESEISYEEVSQGVIVAKIYRYAAGCSPR